MFNLFYNPFSAENLLLKLVCRRYRRRSGWSWREQAGLPKAGHSPFAWPHGHSCSAPPRGTWDSLQKPGPRQKRYHLKTSLYPVEPKNDHLLEASTSKLNSGSVTLREQASSHRGELSPSVGCKFNRLLVCDHGKGSGSWACAGSSCMGPGLSLDGN